MPKTNKWISENNKRIVCDNVGRYLDSHLDYNMGQLSSKTESDDIPDVVGYDEEGGHSYGLYQIATKRGSMNDFIKYMRDRIEYQKFENYLLNIKIIFHLI